MSTAQTSDQLSDRAMLCTLAVMATKVVCVLDALSKRLKDHVEG